MTLGQIRESGLLESYVLGMLSDQEVRRVEDYLLQYPELQKDYAEIQETMEGFAKSQAITPSTDLEASILETIRNHGHKAPVESTSQASKTTTEDSNDLGESGSSVFMKGLLALALGGLLFFAYSIHQKSSAYESLQSDYTLLESQCDSINEANLEVIERLEEVSSKNVRTIKLHPTDNYASTKVLMHINDLTKENVIHIKNLPVIASNHSYQLWSLKPNADPIPLGVFKDNGDILIPVDYEDGTGTYAITIENESGVDSPTMSRLIGTIPLGE